MKTCLEEMNAEERASMGELNTYKLNNSENDWTTKNKGKNEQESTLWRRYTVLPLPSPSMNWACAEHWEYKGIWERGWFSDCGEKPEVPQKRKHLSLGIKWVEALSETKGLTLPLIAWDLDVPSAYGAEWGNSVYVWAPGWGAHSVWYSVTRWRQRDCATWKALRVTSVSQEKGHGWVGGGRRATTEVPTAWAPCSPGTWLSSTPVLQPGLWDSLPGEGLVSGELALWTEQTRALKRNSSFYKSPLWGTQTLNLMFVKHPRTKIQILS